jgi:predicted transcriptional regulator of viral defense system
MTLANTFRRRLFEVALDRYGYVTVDDARVIGVPAVELRKLASRGGITRVGHGVYRFDDVPRSDRDGSMEAVLLVGGDAVLVQDAVLALHDLALVNPRRIRVATSTRVRRRLPDSIEVIRERIAPADRTLVDGIPSTTLARALRDCRGLVMDERLREAAIDARRRGLLSAEEAAEMAGLFAAVA